MKKCIIPFTALFIASTGVTAQTEVTAGIMRGKDYGVTYMLPKTEIEVTIHATQHHYKPGDFCKYADRYLRIKDVGVNQRIYWTLEKVETNIIGVPDSENIYFVKLKDKSSAPLMELTQDGIVRSINLPYSGQPNITETEEAISPTKPVDARQYLTEEILLTTSTAKMAELVAKEIYNIRESKNALLRGEADNMPQDGAQLKLMLDNLNQQEQAMTEMFTGTDKAESKTFTIRISPKEMNQEVICRFSSKLGVISKENLAGEPIYLSINNLKTVPVEDNTTEEEKGKKLEGIAYRVPGKAQVSLSYKQQRLYDEEVPVSQFGSLEFLAPVLFNKNSTTKVLFDTATGGILKVDRGEP